jgi:hypothetical protein
MGHIYEARMCLNPTIYEDSKVHIELLQDSIKINTNLTNYLDQIHNITTINEHFDAFSSYIKSNCMLSAEMYNPFKVIFKTKLAINDCIMNMPTTITYSNRQSLLVDEIQNIFLEEIDIPDLITNLIYV